MSETYYGEWIDVSDGHPPELPDGSIWEVQLVAFETHEDLIDHFECIAFAGVLYLIEPGDITRLRRVYTPGTFTTEPRKLTDPAHLGKWPLWRVILPDAGCVDYTYTLKVAVALAEQSAVSGNRWFFVPVQMIEVGGISRAVDVPWEAVEVGNE